MEPAAGGGVTGGTRQQATSTQRRRRSQGVTHDTRWSRSCSSGRVTISDARSSPHPSALLRPRLRPSERVPARSVPSKPPGFDGPRRARTVASRAGAARTGAVRTGRKTLPARRAIMTVRRARHRYLSVCCGVLRGETAGLTPLRGDGGAVVFGFSISCNDFAAEVLQKSSVFCYDLSTRERPVFINIFCFISLPHERTAVRVVMPILHGIAY